MGAHSFFDEVVTSNDAQRELSRCTVELLDNHGVPELRIGPEGAAFEGRIAVFDDIEQFERFADAVEVLRLRLCGPDDAR